MTKSIDPEDETSFDAAKLYPELTPEQQREAAYYLGRYLEVICRIHERTKNLTQDE